MNSETRIQNLIRIALSDEGVVNFRNNTGILKDRNGRPVRFGLCVGSSDIIGIAPNGRFVAIEVKCEGKKPTEAQVRFIELVKKHGGIAGVAHSVEEALKIVEGA